MVVQVSLIPVFSRRVHEADHLWPLAYVSGISRPGLENSGQGDIFSDQLIGLNGGVLGIVSFCRPRHMLTIVDIFPSILLQERPHPQPGSLCYLAYGLSL